jgi:hypothetical protein
MFEFFCSSKLLEIKGLKERDQKLSKKMPWRACSS